MAIVCLVSSITPRLPLTQLCNNTNRGHHHGCHLSDHEEDDEAKTIQDHDSRRVICHKSRASQYTPRLKLLDIKANIKINFACAVTGQVGYIVRDGAYLGL